MLSWLPKRNGMGKKLMGISKIMRYSSKNSVPNNFEIPYKKSHISTELDLTDLNACKYVVLNHYVPPLEVYNVETHFV